MGRGVRASSLEGSFLSSRQAAMQYCGPFRRRASAPTSPPPARSAGRDCPSGRTPTGSAARSAWRRRPSAGCLRSAAVRCSCCPAGRASRSGRRSGGGTAPSPNRRADSRLVAIALRPLERKQGPPRCFPKQPKFTGGDIDEARRWNAKLAMLPRLRMQTAIGRVALCAVESFWTVTAAGGRSAMRGSPTIRTPSDLPLF